MALCCWYVGVGGGCSCVAACVCMRRVGLVDGGHADACATCGSPPTFARLCLAQGLRHPWDGHGHGGGHGHGDHGHGGGHAPVSGYKYEGGPGGRIVSADDEEEDDDEVEDAHADGDDGEDEDEDDE